MGPVSPDAQMRGNARFGAPCTANPPEPEIVFGLPGDELVFLIERVSGTFETETPGNLLP